MDKKTNNNQEIILLIAVYGLDTWNKEHGTNFKSFEEARNFYLEKCK